MKKLAHLPCVAVLLGFGCAHAAPAQNNAPMNVADGSAADPSSNQKAPDQSDAIFAKFDPALRWALQDKTGGMHAALVDLQAPLPAEARDTLEALGLVFVSTTHSLLHVRGDAQALLRLAAYGEVKRLHASGRMRPSLKEP